MTFFAKLHVDILDDPKLMSAQRKGAKQLHFLPWLLAFAKRADDDGRLTIAGEEADPKDISASIPCATAKRIEQCLSELEQIGVLSREGDGALRFVAWTRRSAGKPSAASNANALRQKRYRDRKRAEREADVTGSDVTQTVTPNGHNGERNAADGERRGKTETKSGDGATPPTAPPAISMPAGGTTASAAKIFMDAYYSSATAARRADVQGQLADVLGGGARFDRNTRVRAGSPERFVAKIDEVLQESVRDHDKAIRILLRKLADTSDGSAPGAVAARLEAEQLEDVSVAGDRAAAEAWISSNEDAARRVSIELDALVPGDPNDSTIAIARRVAYTSVMIGVWRASGAPMVPARTPAQVVAQ